MSVVPSQILYLEHGSSRLYAEAIQIVETRHLCWARPTLLIRGLPEGAISTRRQEVIAAAALNPERSCLQLYDLEGCPDLLWPLSLFDIASDIDFFSLLIQLKMSPNEVARQSSSARLNDFIRSFWHARTGNAQAASPPAS